ncbi:RnfABCDGE type electron transport complex subunit D [Desulfatibacillum aliphaticivorans]|uniref:RnfABCDGE type electron transport complex subunit D n=1 Tax=Desulfatibacillum aliphaticivorans TaxID=218208 RepID=UPI000420657E|nr:RnfABCDGE type electron transport complex subunit D [Desulfatibacillum aliphaticivorans]
METNKKFVVSYAPHCHNGDRISKKSYNMMLAALPAVFFGILQYGIAALSVICLCVSTAMAWELIFNRIMKQPPTIGDGNAALTGLLLGMLMPPVVPWWVILTMTFVTILIGKVIWGGMGGNPFNPVILGYAITRLSWGGFLDVDASLAPGYIFDFNMANPIVAVKSAIWDGAGADAASAFSTKALLLGQHCGTIGTMFGLGLIVGGLYLIIRGYLRWELCLSYLAGVIVTATLFSAFGPEGKYAGATFHVLAGFTLIAAFFFMAEDSSTPINLIPMVIYGVGAGVLTILIRNIGNYADGVIFAFLLMNVLNPLLDNIRPKALGKVVENE